MRIISGIAVLSLSFVFTVRQIHAASNTTSLAIAPAIIESIAKPGESVKTKVKLANQTNIPLPIKGTVRDFIPNEAVNSEDASAFQAAGWFTLNPQDFILQPREEKEIEVTIDAPRGAEPGGHYATIYFEPLVPKEAVSAGSTLSLARVGSLAFLIAPGEIEEKLEIAGITLPDYQTLGPVGIRIKLKNTGNLHLVPTASIRVIDMFGRKVADIKTNIVTVLPKTEREIEGLWDKKYLIGKFTFEGEILYGSEMTKVALEKQSVWILPWHLLLLGLLLLTIVLYVVIVGRKRVKLAWRVLTGKVDAWEPKNATTITLERPSKETEHEFNEKRKTTKNSRRRSRNHS